MTPASLTLAQLVGPGPVVTLFPTGGRTELGDGIAGLVLIEPSLTDPPGIRGADSRIAKPYLSFSP